MCLQAVHPGQARLSAGNALSCLPSARWNGKNAAKYETETRVVAQDKDNRSAAKSWPLYAAIGRHSAILGKSSFLRIRIIAPFISIFAALYLEWLRVC